MAQRTGEFASKHAISDRLHGLTLSNLAVLETMLGEEAHGELLGLEGLLLLQRSPENSGLIPEAMIGLAIALREQGRYADAMKYAEQAYAAAGESDSQGSASFALYHIGKLAFLLNDLDRAASSLTDSLNRSGTTDPSETALYSGIYLAAVHTRRGELVEAAAALREADRLWREIGREIAWLFIGVAGALAAADSRSIDAARIFGADMAHTAAFGVKGEDEPWIADVKIALREQLGEEAFEEANRAGQNLSLDDTLALMRDVLDQIERRAPS